MEFLVGNGEQFKDELRDLVWNDLFKRSKILAVCVENNGIVGACGINNKFNYLGLYVKEQFRGRGIGSQILKKAISTARKMGYGFITLDVSSQNASALHLYSKFQFREIVHFRKSKNIFMMLTLDMKSIFLFTCLRFACYVLPISVLERMRSNRFIKTLLTMIL